MPNKSSSIQVPHIIHRLPYLLITGMISSVLGYFAYAYRKD